MAKNLWSKIVKRLRFQEQPSEYDHIQSLIEESRQRQVSINDKLVRLKKRCEYSIEEAKSYYSQLLARGVNKAEAQEKLREKIEDWRIQELTLQAIMLRKKAFMSSLEHLEGIKKKLKLGLNLEDKKFSLSIAQKELLGIGQEPEEFGQQVLELAYRAVKENRLDQYVDTLGYPAMPLDMGHWARLDYLYYVTAIEEFLIADKAETKHSGNNVRLSSAQSQGGTSSTGQDNSSNHQLEGIKYMKKVFIVHGRNHQIRDKIDLYITKELQLETVVMQAGPHAGRSLIEKFENMASSCDFAVFLITMDDHMKYVESGKEIRRARQNVILEIGFFWGLMGRSNRVAFLVENVENMELPSDIQGIGWIPITEDLAATEKGLLKELRSAQIV